MCEYELMEDEMKAGREGRGKKEDGRKHKRPAGREKTERGRGQKGQLMMNVQKREEE